MKATPRSALRSYTLTVAAAAAALLLRWLLDPVLGDRAPFDTLYGAIAIAVWAGGWRLGIATAVVAFVVAEYLYVVPRGSLGLIGAASYIRTATYFATSGIVVLIGEAMGRAERRAQAGEREMQRLHAELATKVDALRTLVDFLPCGILTADPECNRIVGNPAFYQMLGIRQGGNASLPAADSDVPAGTRVFRGGRELTPDEFPMQATGRTGKSMTDFEHDIVFPDGRRVTLLASTTPLLDGAGKVRSILGGYVDITERMRSSIEIDRARRAAEEANRAKADFLKAMSHELRTPLNAIGGYADLLEMGVQGPVNDAQTESLRRIKRNQQHLLRIVSDILNFARVEAGHIDLQLGPVAIHAVLSRAEALIAPQLAARRLCLDYAGCDPALGVRADPEKLEQILLNLLGNALKFTPPGGHIRLSCDADDDAVRVLVADTGSGIPPDRISSIFDPFVQVNRDRVPDSERGVGLGLSISRQLARSMGGDVAAESVVGEGSTFTVTLQRTELSVVETAVHAPELAATPARQSMAGAPPTS